MVRIFFFFFPNFFFFFFFVGKVVRYNTALARFRGNPDICVQGRSKRSGRPSFCLTTIFNLC